MARPALLPESRPARLALAALVAFALLRGLLFGVTTPPFWGPDEDYHFLYADRLVTQQALPDPDKPLYTREFLAVDEAVDYGSYCCRETRRFRGDPKAAVAELARLGDDEREPSAVERGVGVVHPPLYHAAAAAVDFVLGGASILTRATWLRALSALFGALAVYFAWLLAAQVFRGERLQLLAAFVVAVQPMLGYVSGIVNHDSALIAFSTAALAMMVFVLRSPPLRAQGAWLGGALVLALLVKGSALALLPLAALALAGQALVWPERRRETLRSALVATAIVALLAGPWYVRAALAYDSATGATTPLSAERPGAGQSASLANLVSWTKEWTGLTYRTYWWHYDFNSAPAASPSKFIPAFLGAIAMLGLLMLGWRERRRLRDPDGPVLRQAVLLVLAALAFYLPFLAVDLMRRADGQPFFVTGGRYLLPAFAGVAVLFLLGVGQLVRREAERLVLWSIGAAALVFGGFVYAKYTLQQYIGFVEPGEILRRLTFDRPAFVTSATVVLLVLCTLAALVLFTVMAARSRGPAPGASHYSEAA
jgi:hypothetical protein